jgi:hypothetical protein
VSFDDQDLQYHEEFHQMTLRQKMKNFVSTEMVEAEPGIEEGQ